jgi:hypothetical protein
MTLTRTHDVPKNPEASKEQADVGGFKHDRDYGADRFEAEQRGTIRHCSREMSRRNKKPLSLSRVSTVYETS